MNKSGISLRLPILVHNTGATPHVVRALRLRGIDADKKVFHLEGQSFHTTLDPRNSFEDFVHAFVIPGRSVVTKHIGFTIDRLPHITPGAQMSFVLEAQYYDDEHWRGMKTLEIQTGILINQFLTMSNNPGHWKKNTWKDGLLHQHRLMFEQQGEPYNSADLVAEQLDYIDEAQKGWG